MFSQCPSWKYFSYYGNDFLPPYDWSKCGTDASMNCIRKTAVHADFIEKWVEDIIDDIICPI